MGHDAIAHEKQYARDRSRYWEEKELFEKSFDAGVLAAIKVTVKLCGEGLTPGMIRRILSLKAIEIELRTAGGTTVVQESQAGGFEGQPKKST